MANVTVTLTSTDVNVNTSTNNVTITNTPSNIIVSALPIISNTTVRATLSNVDPILYDQANGIFSINNTTLLSGQTTSNLTEGTNLYFTTARANTNSDAWLATKTADDIAEGSTNKYFTTNNANNAIIDHNTDVGISNAKLVDITDSANVNLLNLADVANTYQEANSTNGVLQFLGHRTIFNDNFNSGRQQLAQLVKGTLVVKPSPTGSGANAARTGFEVTGAIGETLTGASIFYAGSNPANARVGTGNVTIGGYTKINNTLQVSGNASLSNVNAQYLYGDGSNITGINNLTNAQVKVYIQTNGLNGSGDFITTGNVDGNNIQVSGNILSPDLGSGLTNYILMDDDRFSTDANNDNSISMGSVSDVHMVIDTNNNGAGAASEFRISQGNANVELATEIFSVDGSGNITVSGPIFDISNGNRFTLAGVNGNDILGVSALGNVRLDYSTGKKFKLTTNNTTETMHVDDAGNMYLLGNLEVTGNINYREVEDLLVQDQTITLNYGNASAQTSTIFVDRSGDTLTNTAIRWNETTDKWQFSNDGSTYVDLIGSGDIPADAVTSVNTQTGVVVLDTGDLQENGNLFFTTARANTAFDDRLADKTTDDLTEGSTNLYYATSLFDTDFATKTTSDLTEGTNLYYTDARVDAHLSGGTGITYTSGSIDLDDTAVTPKTYGDATNVPQFTVDQQGRITAVSNVAISGGGSYGNVEVTNFLQNGYGSNTITTTGNISAGNIDVTGAIELDTSFTFSNSSQTGTVFTHYSGNVFFADYPNNAFNGSNIHIADKPRSFGSNTQMLKIGQYETNKIPYVGSFYSGPGILTEQLYIEKGMNFGRGVVNLNTFADGSVTLGNADYLFSDQTQNLSNVYINMGTGNVDGTANTVVGIKTNLNSDTRLGWHDPISRTTYAYQSEPVFDASTDPNGWYAFGDLAKTTVDETFDANLTVTGNLIATYLNGDGSNITGITAATTADTSKTTIKTVIAGEDLAKGDAVYISGGTGDNPEVSKADADDAAKMPVFGVTTEAVTATNTTDLVIYGLLESYDTTGFATGDSLFVSTTAGSLTNTKPTGESALLQTVGKVIKGNSSGGKITITGAGRTNATPNLNDGNIFIGNVSNESTTATLDTSIVPENTNLYYTTDRANTAIGAYTGAITNLTGDVTTTADITAETITMANNSQTGASFTHYSGNVFFADYPNNAFSGSNVHIADKPRSFSGANTQMLKIGQYETNKIPYVGSFYSGPGILTEQLYIEKGMNFGRGVVNLNTFADGSVTLGNADYEFSAVGTSLSNVYINIGTGNVDGVANTVVGIKTNRESNVRLGWHDPISRTTYAYQSEPVFDASTDPNGWYAFGDLAKTTVNETFDANLTISGHTSLKGFSETVVALGSQSGNIAALAAFNASNASIFTVTATGGITISEIPNAVAGSSYTIKVTQDGTGSHALTSTFKYQGGDKTLTTAAGNTDVISVVYDGTDYLATLSKDYY